MKIQSLTFAIAIALVHAFTIGAFGIGPGQTVAIGQSLCPESGIICHANPDNARRKPFVPVRESRRHTHCEAHKGNDRPDLVPGLPCEFDGQTFALSCNGCNACESDAECRDSIPLDGCQTTRCDAGVCLVELRPQGALCRAGSGDACDRDEVCDGASPSCPPDVYENDTHVCRTGSGDSCDPDEACPGQPGVPCPPDHVEAAGEVCRPGSNDICDPDETCTGVAGEACPPDDHKAAGFVCNEGSGDICDPDETCSGIPGEACPDDRFAANDATSFTVCHIASAFPVSCRESATCPGVPDQPCPVIYKSSSTVCRAGDDGTCDPTEYCTGSSAACPPDVRNKAEGEVCRPAEGTCDIAERCAYDAFAGGSCPPDVTKPIGAVCRSGSACDPAEVCEEGLDGRPSCPADVTLDDGTLCSPNIFCTDLGECQSGSCVQTGCTAGLVSCECPGIDLCDVPEGDADGTCIACDGVSCGSDADGCGCDDGDYCGLSGVCEACEELGEGECVDSCCPSGEACARIDSTSVVCLPRRSGLCVGDCLASDTLGDICTATHSHEGRAYSDDCDCSETCSEGKCDGSYAAFKESYECTLPAQPDTDCDGVADGADPCPLHANDCCLVTLTESSFDLFFVTCLFNNDECP
jgi:hypothetical protein